MALRSRARRIAGPLAIALVAALALAACEMAAADGTASGRPAAQQASAPSASKPAAEFGSETHHAVVAFQKVNHLDRDGVAGPKTMKALEHRRQPSPRSRSGFHIEADLTLQVVYVVNGSRIEQILDASSASGRTYEVDGDVRVAHTPEGSFHVERKINAWHRSPLGLLYRPAYFVGGYALHGAPSVPPFPASHGCIRITTTAMDRLYDRLALGTPLLVYRNLHAGGYRPYDISEDTHGQARARRAGAEVQPVRPGWQHRLSR